MDDRYRQAQSWNKPQEKVTVYDLKAHVENIFKRLGIQPQDWTVKEETNDLFVHYLAYVLKNGQPMAVFGQVRPSVLKRWDLDEAPIYYAECSWSSMISVAQKHLIHFTELPKYPEVRRDLALLIDKHIHFSQIEQVAFATEHKLLQSVQLFDVYEGKNLPDGKKSYAVSFLLQDFNQTLTDKQIDAVMNRLIKQFSLQLGASLR
jgi:phenylalanyl-tRNA synthetase beta chain